MGSMILFGDCIGCGKLFGFNPYTVPSFRTVTGHEPICRDCIERLNPMRKANGLPPIVTEPDAYEPAEER
jgi:Fe-S-cluster-containing dehydrogenase component